MARTPPFQESGMFNKADYGNAVCSCDGFAIAAVNVLFRSARFAHTGYGGNEDAYVISKISLTGKSLWKG